MLRGVPPAVSTTLVARESPPKAPEIRGQVGWGYGMSGMWRSGSVPLSPSHLARERPCEVSPAHESGTAIRAARGRGRVAYGMPTVALADVLSASPFSIQNIDFFILQKNQNSAGSTAAVGFCETQTTDPNSPAPALGHSAVGPPLLRKPSEWQSPRPPYAFNIMVGFGVRHSAVSGCFLLATAWARPVNMDGDLVLISKPIHRADERACE